MEKAIRVRIMNLEYPLRVKPEDEELAYEVASYVDQKIQSIRSNLPSHSAITATVLAALSIAEELFTLRQQTHTEGERRSAIISELVNQLQTTLTDQEEG